jgi:uncharacterized MnhB-related membrane protein
MSRTTRHLLYALVWLLVFSLAAILLVSASSAERNPGVAMATSQIGSAIWVVGFALIFYSWARLDVVSHGRTPRFALFFALIWPVSFPISHPVYLLLTRGFLDGLVSILKLFCFWLGAGSLFLAFGKLLGQFL